MKWQIESVGLCAVGDVDTQSPTTDLYVTNVRYEHTTDASYPGGWKLAGITTHKPRPGGLGEGTNYEEVRHFNGHLYRLVHGCREFVYRLPAPASAPAEAMR